MEQLREENRQHEDEQLAHNRAARKVLLIRAVKEQNVQMVQIVMQKVIGERVAYAVDALAAFEGAELAENAIHNEIFYHMGVYMQTKNRRTVRFSCALLQLRMRR